MRRAASVLRYLIGMALITWGFVHMLQNYPRRAGIQYAVAGVIGAATAGLGLLIILAPHLIRGLRRWAALIRQE